MGPMLRSGGPQSFAAIKLSPALRSTPTPALHRRLTPPPTLPFTAVASASGSGSGSGGDAVWVVLKWEGLAPLALYPSAQQTSGLGLGRLFGGQQAALRDRWRMLRCGAHLRRWSAVGRVVWRRGPTVGLPPLRLPPLLTPPLTGTRRLACA